jgi:hypothetical protein
MWPLIKQMNSFPPFSERRIKKILHSLAELTIYFHRLATMLVTLLNVTQM